MRMTHIGTRYPSLESMTKWMNIITFTFMMNSLKLRAPKYTFISYKDSPEPRSSDLNFARLPYRSNSYLNKVNRKLNAPPPSIALKELPRYPKGDIIITLTNASSLPMCPTCILSWVDRCVYPYVHAWLACLGKDELDSNTPPWPRVWHHTCQIPRLGMREAEIEYSPATYKGCHLGLLFFPSPHLLNGKNNAA